MNLISTQPITKPGSSLNLLPSMSHICAMGDRSRKNGNLRVRKKLWSNSPSYWRYGIAISAWIDTIRWLLDSDYMTDTNRTSNKTYLLIIISKINYNFFCDTSPCYYRKTLNYYIICQLFTIKLIHMFSLNTLCGPLHIQLYSKRRKISNSLETTRVFRESNFRHFFGCA